MHDMLLVLHVHHPTIFYQLYHTMSCYIPTCFMIKTTKKVYLLLYPPIFPLGFSHFFHEKQAMVPPCSRGLSLEVTKPGALTLYAGIRSTLAEGMHPRRGRKLRWTMAKLEKGILGENRHRKSE